LDVGQGVLLNGLVPCSVCQWRALECIEFEHCGVFVVAK
jgi:hypothetical protein